MFTFVQTPSSGGGAAAENPGSEFLKRTFLIGYIAKKNAAPIGCDLKIGGSSFYSASMEDCSHPLAPELSG